MNYPIIFNILLDERASNKSQSPLKRNLTKLNSERFINLQGVNQQIKTSYLLADVV